VSAIGILAVIGFIVCFCWLWISTKRLIPLILLALLTSCQDRQAFEPAPELPTHVVMTIRADSTQCVYHLSRETARKVATARTLTIELCRPGFKGPYNVEVKP
jgi:hypothetical protein